MHELRALVRELATAPSAGQADALIDAVAIAEPSAELCTFIDETLELLALHEVRDSRGITVRWRLIDRLLSLGFPWALHVAPDDLDYHRERGGNSGTAVAKLTLIVALLSSLWAFAFSWGVLALGDGAVFALALPAFLATLLHNVTAVVTAARATSGSSTGALKALGWSGLAAPAVAGLTELMVGHGAGYAVLMLGTPTMITAMLCGLTAALIGSAEPAGWNETKQRTRAPAAARTATQPRVRTS